MIAKPKLIDGAIFSDERGQISFVNDFDATATKRFYIITHPDTKVVRAWNLHQNQKRWFYCISGTFDVRLAYLKNINAPEESPVIKRHLLTSTQAQILEIPEGYAHGFRALEPQSKLLVFSDSGLNEGKGDDFRFPSDKWTDWFKEI